MIVEIVSINLVLKDVKKQNDCGDDEICDDSGNCIHKPGPKGCKKQNDCGDDEICDNSGNCIPKPGPKQYYCVVDPYTHLNKCNQFTNTPEQYFEGPYDDVESCKRVCKNSCGNIETNCNKGAVCASGNCVSCFENKVTLDNASNNSIWYFSYDNHGYVSTLPLILSKEGGKSNRFFTSYTGDTSKGQNVWKIINEIKNTFDLDLEDGTVVKNFQLKNNNMYESIQIEYDSSIPPWKCNKYAINTSFMCSINSIIIF